MPKQILPIQIKIVLKNINENTNIEESTDVHDVIRYFVVHNFDSYTGSMIHNYYLYEEDGALSMIPWDYTLTPEALMFLIWAPWAMLAAVVAGI